jgi:sugar phosphate isomerase/epimerase
MMLRSPLGLRLSATPVTSLRDVIRRAAAAGARGFVLEPTGDLAPERLGETGRRELRQLLRSTETTLAAIALPTRRSFETPDQLDDRLARIDRALKLAYELGARLALIRLGRVPPAEETRTRPQVENALRELAGRAEHRGLRLAIETGAEPAALLRALLDGQNAPSLAASLDPAAFLRMGLDPVAAARELGPWVAHAYASDAQGVSAANPRGFGYAPGVLDWPEYLGSLEEIDYRGFLTVWPEPAADPVSSFATMNAMLQQIA